MASSTEYEQGVNGLKQGLNTIDRLLGYFELKKDERSKKCLHSANRLPRVKKSSSFTAYNRNNDDRTMLETARTSGDVVAVVEYVTLLLRPHLVEPMNLLLPQSTQAESSLVWRPSGFHVPAGQRMASQPYIFTAPSFQPSISHS